MLRSKSLTALAAVLATGVTLGALSLTQIGLKSPPVNGISLNGMPFNFNTVSVSVQDVLQVSRN
jgi:hypothetical protein